MYGLDPGRLQTAAADHLERRIAPLLNDADARAQTDALVRLLRRAGVGIELDQAAAQPLTAGVLDADAIGVAQAAIVASMARVAEATAPAQAEKDDVSEAALTEHLRLRLGDADVCAARVLPVVGGFSKQTVLFDLVTGAGAVESLVLRRDLPDSPVETSVRDEFPALCDLYAAGLPVPEPRWLDDGSEYLPGPFLVSRRVAGRPIGDPAGGASAGLAFDPTDLLATTLARVHAVPVTSMTRSGLSDTTWDQAALVAQIDYWQRRYAEHRPGPIPVLESAFSWVRRHYRLGLQPPVVIHGDYGFYNMLVENGTISAIVDWELIHIGSSAWDLAYVRDHVGKLGTYERFLSTYAAARGVVPPPEAIDYFHVFSLIRTVTMCLVVFTSFNRGEMSRIPLVDVCQMIYPLHLSSLAAELARVSHADPPGLEHGADG